MLSYYFDCFIALLPFVSDFLALGAVALICIIGRFIIFGGVNE